MPEKSGPPSPLGLRGHFKVKTFQNIVNYLTLLMPPIEYKTSTNPFQNDILAMAMTFQSKI